MKYWLMKSEPSTYSIDDLKREKKACWDGVRNYQARNFMRDEMQVGDLVLFYHSNATPPGIVGVAKVCKTAYPDHTAWDKRSKYYDARSSKEKPVWMMVDVAFVKKFPEILPLGDLKEYTKLKNMLLLKKGTRLSIQPVTKSEVDFICGLAQK
ncbi:EVE domain-containing protein [Simkania sp.]|uniref:EVE domain-containing protein n=1 Tax=Simkania sp. TaxID=34094 RepID=UPI003B51BC4D